MSRAAWRAGRAVIGAVGRAVRANPNATVFALGLTVLCVSVARWSEPLAGALLGVVLMTVAAWPLLARTRHD